MSIHFETPKTSARVEKYDLVFSRWFLGPFMQKKMENYCISKSTTQSLQAQKAKSTSARHRLDCKPWYLYMIFTDFIHPRWCRISSINSIKNARKWQWNHILETKDANHHARSQLASRRGKDSHPALPNFSPTFGGVGNSSKWHRSALSKLLKTCWNPGTLRFCATWCDFLTDKTEQAGWLVQPFSHFLNHRGPPSPMLLAKMSSRHHLGKRCAELGSDWCIYRNFECKKASMRQCLVDVLYIFIFLMHRLSPCPFLWLQIHQHWHQKLSKKGQTSLQNKNVSLACFPVSEKNIHIYIYMYIYIILLCALLAWLGWAFAWPACEHGFPRIAALALLGCWCHFVCSRLTLPWLHAHAKPNVACRQMCAAVCFFLTTGGKPVWGSIFDWIKKHVPIPTLIWLSSIANINIFGA